MKDVLACGGQPLAVWNEGEKRIEKPGGLEPEEMDKIWI